ncbi:uncharacterized protein LOC108679775 [Hyalella azteca]|uniref:Uncharacterized protein LOC108679775 n=1 Tax=Hyalella azteca TaxID=294128 RepID=A0A8B7PCX1_HYAAZ|nr:uncharacterized protein LOC108679775 [Hyalella azteca]
MTVSLRKTHAMPNPYVLSINEVTNSDPKDANAVNKHQKRSIKEHFKMPTEEEYKTWDFFTDFTVRPSLNSQQKVEKAIKCILESNCDCPDFSDDFKKLLKVHGVYAVLKGGCSPYVSCTEEEFRAAITFHAILRTDYPDLYQDTVNLIHELDDAKVLDVTLPSQEAARITF